MSRPDTKFTIRVPATSANIGPGYDVIAMALEIYNDFVFEVGGKEKLKIEVAGEGAAEIPTNDSNLVYQAFLEGFKHYNLRPPNLYIKQTNNIPVSRGLGSSASAILAGLMLAKALIGKKFTKPALLELAVEMEGHADNLTAAYYGGVVLNYEAGKATQIVKFLPPHPLAVALAIPEIKISTVKAREILPPHYPVRDVVTNLQNLALLIYALSCGEYELLKPALRDTLHQPYRAKLIPGFNEVFHAAVKAGAWGVALSGSGSTVIALCKNKALDIACQMAAAFAKQGISCKYMVSKISEKGAFVI